MEIDIGTKEDLKAQIKIISEPTRFPSILTSLGKGRGVQVFRSELSIPLVQASRRHVRVRHEIVRVGGQLRIAWRGQLQILVSQGEQASGLVLEQLQTLAVVGIGNEGPFQPLLHVDILLALEGRGVEMVLWRKGTVRQREEETR
jgi:hypothetical protein